MALYFTREKNAQVILYLLKAHGIKHVIASPGTTNTALVMSMLQDSYFVMYSAVDERSAAYMACGLAAELNEPVVISCTGATASRNYLPGMTEAYYRKIPVLAITSSQDISKIGHHVAQVIDRSVVPNDAVNLSVTLPIVKDNDDLWDCEVKVNTAILALKRDGGGPVHINLPTTYSKPFDVKSLPAYRMIERITVQDSFPDLRGRVAVFVGAHKPWAQEEIAALDAFCQARNAIVLCDHTSGYRGKYRLLFSLVAAQGWLDKTAYLPDVLIHIGEISGDYPTLNMAGKQVWRISPDGEVRDAFRRLRYVFAMTEQTFFERYTTGSGDCTDYFDQCNHRLIAVRAQLPELPMSNVWLASELAHRIPPGSAIHFGILNSLRTWNFFELPSSVNASANVGGFGIDGSLSSLIGASLANQGKLYFAVLGDLAFFYDINALGNRHSGNNLRILLVNNGKGTEFRQYNHHAAYFGDAAESFVAAAGHFGNKSTTLVKNFATDLGYHYLTAKTKLEFKSCVEQFVSPEITNSSIILEVFTDSDLESQALEAMQTLVSDHKGKTQKIVKSILGTKGVNTVRAMLRR